MNRPVKSFKNACTSAWKWSSRFPVTKVCSYKILKFCISHLSFFLATFFSQAIKQYLGIFLHIIHLISVNIWLKYSIIDYSSGRTQKGKLLADFPRHQWQISSVMVGKEEEETEVFLETLARLLIDPAIGHFKLGCFNQPRNSSMMAFSFYVFFSDRTLLCLVIL